MSQVERRGRGSYRALFDLKGRVAVVTGATGILGPHCCAALADHGASVVAVDQAEDAVARLAHQLRERFAATAYGMVCDVADGEAVERLVAEVDKRVGPIDILHNNAATKGESLSRFCSDPTHYPLNTWNEVMAVNLTGAFQVAQAVGRRMAERGRGSIINMSSVYGVLGTDQRIYEMALYEGVSINTPPVYAASKAGLLGLTRYLASLWGHRGVRVNALSPGGVASGQNDQFQERYSARVPMGRMARVDEVVGALVFLAADASSYVTGQNIIVDGGMSAW